MSLEVARSNQSGSDLSGAVGVRSPRFDAAWVITVFLALRILVPARLVIEPLGAAGHPAAIFGLGCLAWWAFHRIQRDTIQGAGRQWIRAAAGLFVAASLASYVVAATRPLDPAEQSVADTALLQVASWLGVLMLAADGVSSKPGMMSLFRWFVALVAFIAALGIVQFLTGEAYIDRISLPGFTELASLMNIADRNGFSRAAGTTIHPIEFGAVLTLAFPVALALAFGENRRNFLLRATPCLLIGMAIILSVSRSAILGLVVGLIVLFPALPSSRRILLIIAGALCGVTVFLTIPGLSGTILGMFTDAAGDSSVLSRTDSYPMAWEFIRNSPLFGRGLGTFLPQFRILDNQYLLILIEVGIIGLTALLFLLIAGIRTAIRTSRLPRTASDWSLLNRGAAAGVAAGAAELAFFDGFSFPVFISLLFALLGLIGAMERLTRFDLAHLDSAEVKASQGRASANQGSSQMRV